VSELSTREQKLVERTVDALVASAEDRLAGVLLYGPAAHGDHIAGADDLHLFVVLEDLSLSTLRAIATPIQGFKKNRQPLPRIFSRDQMTQAADVFPMEFVDIQTHHKVLQGDSCLEGIEIDREHLRLQCERVLREKMLRLREAYLDSHKSERRLRKLIVRSVPDFSRVFRGFLFLHEDSVPRRDSEVMSAFARHAKLDPAPFQGASALAMGGKTENPTAMFEQYYQSLTQAVGIVDAFSTKPKEVSS